MSSSLKSFLYDAAIIVPLKIDISYKGARYVDSFCWKLFDALLTPEEFANTTCADLSLPPAFHHRIAFQMKEQIAAYREIVSMFRNEPSYDAKLMGCFNSPIEMLVGIRYNTLDCTFIWQTVKHKWTHLIILSHPCLDSDKFMWDLASTANSGPEVFARKTGNLLLIYICNFHVLNYFLLIYICKFHWNRYSGRPWTASRNGASNFPQDTRDSHEVTFE